MISSALVINTITYVAAFLCSFSAIMADALPTIELFTLEP